MAGFCELALGLQVPDFYPLGAKTPKVSGRTPEYSHFRETGTGDWVSIGTSTIGYLFPVGDMQGYLNLKGYGEFDAANRPAGWNTWLTSPIELPPGAVP
jgi:hypothetical protein